jgi:NADPH-dependent 2,4-dienoyl-CoA reductase/sulfur reductase-like enzyme
MKHLLVVGASLAGHRCAIAAKKASAELQITVIGTEDHLPYQRPPLSKQLLTGKFKPERLILRGSADSYTLVPQTTADALDAEAKVVFTSSGQELHYDALAITTGASPRILPNLPPSSQVIYLRTKNDSLALAGIASNAKHIAIVGAGFIGLEVAASLREMGLDVSVFDLAKRPLVSSAGDQVAQHLENLHRSRGVKFNFQASIFSYDGQVLETGTDAISADAVVVGIGVAANSSWLASSNLATDSHGNVIADSFGWVDRRLMIGTAGDVASWFHPLYQRHIHFEHFETAASQGRVLGTNLAHALANTGDSPVEYLELPFGWSDQFGHLVQFLGVPGPDALEEEIQVEEGKAWLYHRNGKIEGAISIDSPTSLTLLRDTILDSLDR